MSSLPTSGMTGSKIGHGDRLRRRTPRHAGALTFVQRFGSLLNLNRHAHVLVANLGDDEPADRLCRYGARSPVVKAQS